MEDDGPRSERDNFDDNSDNSRKAVKVRQPPKLKKRKVEAE